MTIKGYPMTISIGPGRARRGASPVRAQASREGPGRARFPGGIPGKRGGARKSERFCTERARGGRPGAAGRPRKAQVADEPAAEARGRRVQNRPYLQGGSQIARFADPGARRGGVEARDGGEAGGDPRSEAARTHGRHGGRTRRTGGRHGGRAARRGDSTAGGRSAQSEAGGRATARPARGGAETRARRTAVRGALSPTSPETPSQRRGRRR